MPSGMFLWCISERYEHLLCDSMAGRAAIATRKQLSARRECISAVFWQQDLRETAQRPVWVGWNMTGFTALISGVIRLQAVTLEEFTLNLIFMVSWNGNCFLPVNKAVGTLPYKGCEQTITVCYGPLTAGHSYQWRFWSYRNFISPRASSLSCQHSCCYIERVWLLQKEGKFKVLEVKNAPVRKRTT